MLVVTRFVVGPDEDPVEFSGRAGEALRALAACRGYLRGRMARSLDEPTHWCLVTEWASVGAYRRALSSFEVRTRATQLLAASLDEPSAYEVLVDADAEGRVAVTDGDRADVWAGRRPPTVPGTLRSRDDRTGH